MRRRKLTLAGLTTGLVLALAAATGAQAASTRSQVATAARVVSASPLGAVQVPPTGGARLFDVARPALSGAAHTSWGNGSVTKYTVTVTGTNLSGKPDTGDTAVLVSAENVIHYQVGTFQDGSVKFSAPAGPYWVVAVYNNLARTGAGEFGHMDVLAQLSVARNTTVHTAARAATSEVTMVTPRPAKPDFVNFDVDLKGQHGRYYDVFSWFGFGKVWVNPLPVRPAVGRLWCYAEQTLIGTATGVTPYAYNLDYADTPGTIPPQRYVVKASSLATTTNEYYEDAATRGAWASLGTFRYQAGASPFVPLALPGKLVQYYSTGGGGVSWSPLFVEILGSPRNGLTGGQAEQAFLNFRPGQHQVVDWNRYPLHPKPAYSAGGAGGALLWTQPSAIRTGNALTLTLYLFGDSVPGHIAGPPNQGTKSTVTYTIDQNGVKIASGAVGRRGIPPATLSGKPSVVKVTFDAAWTGPDYKLSKATQTVWTWHSSPDPTATVPHDWVCASGTLQRRCSVQSMMMLDYRVSGMRLNGTVPSGKQAIDLSVGHIQLAAASAIKAAGASASCDGGKTWQTATVTALGHGRYKLGFTESGGCDVTLRTSAHDAAGDSITETITDAYAVTS